MSQEASKAGPPRLEDKGVCVGLTTRPVQKNWRQQTRTFTWGRYHGGRRPSSDDSFHSPTVIPPSALDKSSIMKRYHRRQTKRWGVTARSPTMVTLNDTRFVECRWWNDGWTVKTVVTWRSSASMIPAPWQGNVSISETCDAVQWKPKGSCKAESPSDTQDNSESSHTEHQDNVRDQKTHPSSKRDWKLQDRSARSEWDKVVTIRAAETFIWRTASALRPHRGWTPPPPPLPHTESVALGPYAPQGSRKLRKWSRRSKSVLPTF